MKSIINFLLAFSLIIPNPAPLFAREAPIEAPVSDVGGTGGSGSAPVAVCKAANETLTGSEVCCAGLKPDASLKCVADNSARDPSLKYCSGRGRHNECSNGNGCYPMSMDDMFNSLPGTDEELARQADLENQVDTDQGNWDEEPRAAGAECTKNFQCESYACEYDSGRRKSFCVQKFICRKAQMDEVVSGNAQCEEGLTAIGGLCKYSQDEMETVYLGLLDEATPMPVEGQQCQFKLSEDVRKKSVVAIESSRAMEWLLANMDAGDDCMRINRYLRDEVAKDFLRERQAILNDFNLVLAGIDKDQKTLMDAKDKGTEPVTIDGTQMASGDLASRRTSGYDMLKLMWRRNLLFQSYEYRMNQLTDKTFQKIKSLSASIESGNAGWGNHKKKEWNVVDKHYRGKRERCRGGGFLGLGRRRVWKRWTTRAWIKSTDENMSTLSNKNVSKNLSYILGKNEDDVMNAFKNRRIGFFNIRRAYLLDPLIKPERKNTLVFRPIILGLLTGGLGSVGVLKMAKLAETKEIMRENIRDYYKSLKLDPQKKDFVYEPELVPVEVRDCIDKPSGKGCEKFEKFLNNITDVAFAQFIAWSYHNRKDYKHYFNKAETWRRKLLGHWMTQLGNQTEYYKEIATYRDEQNKCIEKVINKVVDDHMDDSMAGLSEDANNYYDGGNNYNQGAAPRPKITKSELKLSKPDRAKYQFNLGTESFSLKDTVMKDNVARTASNSGSANFGASGLDTSTLASRVKDLKDANAKAAAAGVKVADKQKAYDELVASLDSGSSVLLGGTGAMDSSGMANTFGRSGGAVLGNAALDKETQDDKSSRDGKNEMKNNTNTASIPSYGQGSYGQGSMYGSGGQGSSSSSSGSGEYKDPTGMSDEEKAVIMANYDRNRSDYQAKEDDSLFKMLSKAYVRSLDKVLTKKKRIEE